MKKSVVVVFFTSVLIILSFCFSVYAQSGSVEINQDNIKPEDICKNYNLFQKNNPINEDIRPYIQGVGCDCITKSDLSKPEWSYLNTQTGGKITEIIVTDFSRTNFGRDSGERTSSIYCKYTDELPGTVVECMPDADTEIIKNLSEDHNVHNLECEAFAFPTPYLTTPFCNDKNICSECIVGDNDYCYDRAKYNKIPYVSNAVCMKTKYFDAGVYPNTDVCTYCQDIEGNGEITITFAGDLSFEEAKIVKDRIVEFQPFNYMYKNNMFKFNYANILFELFINTRLISFGLNQELSENFLNMLNEEELAKIQEETNKVCTFKGNKHIIIYFSDEFYPTTCAGINFYNYNTILISTAINDPTAIITQYNLIHELGHSFNVADEYIVTDENEEVFYAPSSSLLNIDDSSLCPKFKLLNEPRCFYLLSLTSDNPNPSEYSKLFKSTALSIMVAPPSIFLSKDINVAFNQMSCQAILLDAKVCSDSMQAFTKCQEWVCKKDDYIGIEPQDSDECEDFFKF